MNATTRSHDDHLSADEIARFIDDRDALDPRELARVRDHVRACASCAAALAGEAARDEGLRAVEAEIVMCAGCLKPAERASFGDAADTTGRPARCDHCGAAFAPGGYSVERVLHESDHGRLYLADGDEGPVALKEIVFARVPDVAALDRFERETRMLRQLQHPRIPRYVASFTEGEGVHLRLYLAQRYVDGPSLLDELETRRFDEAAARAVARETLAILVDLQALAPPVLHRDVKPANLVRDADGKLTLVDFGSARDVKQTTGGTLVGTFGYMPMEQLTGVVDESTDVYALGATLVHLLTRRPPWEALEGAPPPAIAGVAPAFADFIARMLCPKNAGRFASAKEALAALDGVDAGRPPERARADRRRPWVAVAGTAAAIAAAVAVAAPLALQMLRERTPAPEATTSVAPSGLVVPAPPIAPPAPSASSDDDFDDGLVGSALDAPNGLSRSDARVVLKALLPALVEACGESDASSAMVIEWQIEPTGKVSRVRAHGGDNALRACFMRSVGQLRFPFFEGEPVTVTQTIDWGVGDAERPAAKGTLKIRAKPWARVRIDGVDIGATPISSLSLKPGAHSLTLTSPAGGTKSMVVTVKSGADTVITHAFDDVLPGDRAAKDPSSDASSDQSSPRR